MSMTMTTKMRLIHLFVIPTKDSYYSTLGVGGRGVAAAETPPLMTITTTTTTTTQ
jgi:hypothetical protein